MNSSAASHPEGPEILRQYVSILKRRRRLIAVFTLAVVALGAAGALLRPGNYRATTTVVTKPIPGEIPPGGGRSRTVNLDTEIVTARSEEIIAAIAAKLDIGPNKVRTATSVEPAPFGDALYFTFEGGDTRQAATGAAAYADAYLAARRAAGLATLDAQRAELARVIAENEKELTNLQTTIDATAPNDVRLAVLRQQREGTLLRLNEANTKLSRIDADVTPGSVTREADVPGSRQGLSLPVSVLGGLFAGLLIGVFAAFIRDRLDRRFLALDDPSRIGLRELGAVPEKALSGGSVLDEDVEAQHTLLRILLQLARLAPVQGGMSILVTAPDHHSVPNLAGLLQGFARVAKSNGDSAAVMQVSWAAVFGDALTNRGADGRWEQVRGVLDQMTSRNRYVFVDPPPLDRSADTLAIASHVDVILLVVSDLTPVDSVVKAKDELAGIGRKVAGYVRIRRSRRRSGGQPATGRIPMAVQVDLDERGAVAVATNGVERTTPNGARPTGTKPGATPGVKPTGATPAGGVRDGTTQPVEPQTRDR